MAADSRRPVAAHRASRAASLRLALAVAWLLGARIAAPAAPVPIEGVPTGVAGFAGTASGGPQGEPVLLTSISDFLRTFGEPATTLETPWLAPSVAAFFLNGGQRCWVVRIADDASEAAFSDGLAVLGAIDEIALVCAPGATSPGVQAALIAHCEAAGDRLALLDAAPGLEPDQVLAQRAALSSPRGFAGLYTPWLRVAEGELPDDIVPPSGFVAGALARADLERGVWEVPTASLQGAIGLERSLTSGESDDLNVAGVSTIRAFTGQGIRIWGARTIANDAELKYIPVRRLLFFLEESIVQGTRWAVLESNEPPLWTRLRASVEGFLTIQWRAGALQGVKPEEAFFVRVDESSMTQADLDAGRTVILLGVATTRLAEFTLLRIAIERGPTSPPFRRADPNGDGQVDLSDAVATLDWLFLGGLRPACLDAADANADALVDISDATFVLAWLFLGGLVPPGPFPACAAATPLIGCAGAPAGCL